MASPPDPYVNAIHLLERSLKMIDQKSDPGLWAMSNGLAQLAEAIQQDLRDIRKRVGEIDSDIKRVR